MRNQFEIKETILKLPQIRDKKMQKWGGGEIVQWQDACLADG